MKQLILLFSAILLISCTDTPKNFATFSGKIINKSSDSIVISSRASKYTKTISVNEDGTFSDTLNIKDGIYSFYDGNESTSIFLKNGYDIQMSLDTKMFDETAKYTGIGSENSNFLAEKSLLTEKLLDVDFSKLDEKGLQETLNNVKKELNSFIASKKDLDTMVSNDAIKSIKPMLSSQKKYYGDIIALKRDLPKGATSPAFENYENHKGGTTSLVDLKGKYVYVDVWATWCGPCRKEIPFLQEVEKEFHGKNIAFVSVSIDRAKDHSKWEKMVADKQLGGIQLFADKDWKSKFVMDYKINGIPRFILIDPDGNIVSADAPRPSSPDLKTLLNELI